jgi:hypothetical protein
MNLATGYSATSYWLEFLDDISCCDPPRAARAACAGRVPRSPPREGILKLLAIKDSDIRLLTLEQCRDAVDKSLHAGGAFSATIPLVTLYYGGFIDVDVADPTRAGQDLFVLSKGHAVAALASIYASWGTSIARSSEIRARTRAF